MKKGSYFLLRKANWLLAGLLVLLGCGDSDDPGVVICEYGSPYSTYEIKGKVTNETDEVIQGIRMRARYAYTRDWEQTLSDTTKTDVGGYYSFKTDVFAVESIQLFAEDIDGDENGAFESDSITISQDEIKLENGERWFLGEGEKTVNFKLKKKR
ncbi:radical SAM-associated putative lipoprotein [Parabacteroides sp. PF5-9]|uniref:radical SAM-associated putative lipoprotein n=1 Tax=Parabacteroides sp. PF5-9 TaxID=1742404 RepID=UPI0024741A37|nr:radical SAM-associated putative lipoprotein [Parabacteroides sp. PF5-9]MDH6359174.1 putative lipoprotein (rSAM/lipoprotein system) [Parabacteroides sp. PF5-9]